MLKKLSLISLISLAASGCVLDDSDSDASYSFELNLGEVNNGVAEVTVQVIDNDGDALPNNQVNVTPNMQMVDNNDGSAGMAHGTPFSSNAGALNENGQFTTTAYFLMPSSMDGTEETKMGDWSITVEFDGESKTFPIDVVGMSDRQILVGDDQDQIPNMSSTANRSYYIFNRGRTVMNAMNDMPAMNSFEIYVAARESMMDYAPITLDATLNEGDNSAELTIDSLNVTMCISDCESETATWAMAMAVDGKEGVYKAMNLGLTGDDTDSVHVKLTVNGTEKLKGDEGRANFSFTTMDMGMNSGMAM